MVELTAETKGVIWDLDGTLLNSFGIFEDLIAKVAPEFGAEVPTQKDMLTNYHGSLTDTISALFGSKLSTQQIDAFEQRFLETQEGSYSQLEGHLFEDALDLSSRLTMRGIRQVVVTNRNHEGRGDASPRSIVERTALVDHIEHIICGDETDKRKPDKQVLGSLLEDWGIKGSELVVIGDQHVDAQLALNLGARAIIVTRDGAEFASHHLTDENWQQHITLVSSLHDVSVGEMPAKSQ